MSEPVLDVDDLRKRRADGDGSFEVVLPSLRLERGEFCALVGASGSGKSTLLDMLGLVLGPSVVGRFRLGGASGAASDPAVDVAGLWRAGRDAELARLRRHRMGYVLQSGGLVPFLSVEANIELPRRLCALGVDSGATRAALRRFGLGFGPNKPVAELSGGERQRVAILRALSHRPSLVLADEPTAAVDASRARSVIELLRGYAAESGAAVLVVTHDRSLMEGASGREIRLARDESTGPGSVRYVASEAGVS